MGFALIEQPPSRGKRGRGRGRGRRARDPVKTPGRTREERCLPELLSRLSLGKHAQKLKHLDYAGMKSVDQDDLETLGLDAEAAARLIGASRREVGELLFYKPQGFGFIRPLGETDRKKNIMAHRSAFSHPSVPLRLPPSSLVAYALGSHNGATVAREVRPLDASQAPVLQGDPEPPAAVVTPPASPPAPPQRSRLSANESMCFTYYIMLCVYIAYFNIIIHRAPWNTVHLCTVFTT